MNAGTDTARRVWVGLAIVGCAAAVLSFGALAELARFAGIVGAIDIFGFEFQRAWLFPLSVDVFAITASYIALSRRFTKPIERYATACAWAAIATTIVGNGYHGYLLTAMMNGHGMPWEIAVIVSAIPAIALGALVHLAVLVGRDLAEQAAARPAHPRPSVWERLGDDALADAWSRPIRAWIEHERAGRAGTGGDRAEAGGPGEWPPPARGSSNDELALDLQRVDAARAAHRPEPLGSLARDAVVERYGVGKERARKLRELADGLARAGTGGRADEQPPAASREPVDDPTGASAVDHSDDGLSTAGRTGRAPGGAL